MAIVLAVLALAGCKATSGAAAASQSAPTTTASASASRLSLAQKLTTIQVCAQVAGDLQTLATAAAKAATGSSMQVDLAAQLSPLEAKLSALAQANSTLPIGTSLQSLSRAISALAGLSSSSPADIAAAAQNLVTAVKDVVSACVAIKS